MKVPVDKIGEVIGPKGKMINQIQDDTGADISIEDDGTVYIGATDGPSAEAARAAINAIANPQMPEVGERFLGHRRQDDDLRRVHLARCPARTACCTSPRCASSSAASGSTTSTTSLKVGQKVQVELKEIDPRGKLSLARSSPRARPASRPRRPSPATPASRPRRSLVSARSAATARSVASAARAVVREAAPAAVTAVTVLSRALARPRPTSSSRLTRAAPPPPRRTRPTDATTHRQRAGTPLGCAGPLRCPARGPMLTPWLTSAGS